MCMGLSRSDRQYLKVLSSKLELALKNAVWTEPNMAKCSRTSRPGVPRMWLSSGMGKKYAECQGCHLKGMFCTPPPQAQNFCDFI